MDSLKHFIEKRPATFTVAITLISVGLLFVAKLVEPDPAPLFNIPRLTLLVLISVITIRLLSTLGWQKEAGLTSPMSSWQGRWYLTPLPLLLIALLSLTSADLSQSSFVPVNLVAWLLANVATGFFEEVLMRGLCFYLLLKAWGTTRTGVFKAALFQALIFGLAHLGNLNHMPLIDVMAQVIFATLIGIGFAGIVYLSKSLWPAILVHSVINAAGSFNEFFVPGLREFQSPGLAGYLVVITLFFVLATIPGLLYLRRGTTRFVSATQHRKLSD